MKHCEECKVFIANDAQHCPLCGGVLGEADGAPCANTYPVIAEDFYRYNFLFRLAVFASLVTVAVCLLIDFLTADGRMGWSIIVLSGVAYLWVTVVYSLRSMSNFAFRYGAQIVSVSLVLYVIDIFTGSNNWALNYAIPFFLILATLAVTLQLIIRRMVRTEYLLCQLVIGLFGLAPLLFMPLGFVDVAWPSIASGAYSLITLGGTFLFADRSVGHELKKRFHI